MERSINDKLTAKARKLYNETAIVESVTDPAKVKGYILTLIAGGRINSTWIGNTVAGATTVLGNRAGTCKRLGIVKA